MKQDLQAAKVSNWWYKYNFENTDIFRDKDVAVFLKKRAMLEEEYGKQMIKLAQSMTESYDKGHSKKR